MDRGVVVGGLMICGSFLLAAMLNRSAMEERPAPATTVSLESVVPVTAPAVQSGGASSIIDCVDEKTHAEPHGTAAAAEPIPADLMVNGRAACPR